MKDFYDFIVSFLVISCIFCAGAGFGGWVAMEAWKKAMVDAGRAEWVVTPDGRSDWRWKEKP